MRHPFWKRWLSYFKEISLEQTSSLSNPYLEVLLVEGRHQLATRDAIYSFDDKYINFDFAFGEMDWSQVKGNRVLLLGLGLGSVILLLEKKHGKKLDYTAIEIDREICRLCSEYTLGDLDSFVEVIPVEAMTFIDRDTDTYDLVIMDVFQSGDIPQKFQSESFLRKLKDRLKPGGLMLYNRLRITALDKEENAAFRVRMKKVFKDMKELEIKNNIVFASGSRHFK